MCLSRNRQWMEISTKEGVLKHFRRFSDNCPGGKLLTTLILILSSKSSANPNQGAIFLDRNCPDTISKNSQGSTCAGVCWALTTLLKRDSSTGIFLWIFRNFKNTYFVKHLHWLLLFITLSDCGNQLHRVGSREGWLFWHTFNLE